MWLSADANRVSSPNRIRLPVADLSATTTMIVPTRKIAPTAVVSTFVKKEFAELALFASHETDVPSVVVRLDTLAIHLLAALLETPVKFLKILSVIIKENEMNLTL